MEPRHRSVVARLCVLFFLLLTCLLFLEFVRASSLSAQTSTVQYLKQPLETSSEKSTSRDSSSMPPALNRVRGESSGDSLTWFMAKIVVGLGVVSGGIWGLGRLMQTTGLARGGNGVMEIRSTLPVGKGQYVQVVQVGGQFFMLGVTEKNVRLLGEITDSDTIQDLRSSDFGASQPPEESTFSNLLARFTGTQSHQFAGSGSVDLLQNLRHKVQDLRSPSPDSES